VVQEELDLDVLAEQTKDIPFFKIFTDVILSQIIREDSREDSLTALNGTANLSRGLPDDLSEVRWNWVVGIIFRNFISPALDSL